MKNNMSYTRKQRKASMAEGMGLPRERAKLSVESYFNARQRVVLWVIMSSWDFILNAIKI